MYHETYHPVNAETLRFALDNKSYSEEERAFIAEEVAKANAGKVRNFKVILPSGEFLEFRNGIFIGGRADGQ